MVILIGELVGAVAHISYYFHSQFLCFFRFSVMFASKGNQTFCQTYETYAQRSLIDNRGDCIVWFQFFATYP